MARVVFIIGESGSGKSASIRNLPIDKSVIITPNDKQLPWKGAATKWKGRMPKKTDFLAAVATMKAAAAKGVKYIVLEDYQHFFNHQMYSDAFVLAGQTANKYARYETLGRDAARVITEAAALPKDVIVFILGHTEMIDGKHVLQLFGQMVRNSVKPEGWTEVILHAMVNGEKEDPNERYLFLTNDDGTHMAKSPMGMFPEQHIHNDLTEVIAAITEFDKE